MGQSQLLALLLIYFRKQRRGDMKREQKGENTTSNVALNPRMGEVQVDRDPLIADNSL